MIRHKVTRNLSWETVRIEQALLDLVQVDRRRLVKSKQGTLRGIRQLACRGRFVIAGEPE